MLVYGALATIRPHQSSGDLFLSKVVNKKISFDFNPFIKKDKSGNNTYTVTKSDGNSLKRYIEGIASGVNIDQHGERMTPNAIQSFMNQANSGDILLYADVHGIRSSEDIGILDSAKILPDGDWFVSFRLYDSTDGLASKNIEIADTIWKQINGLPPYKTPRQKGFSVEGNIPDGFIKSVTADGKRIIDDINLDGVVIVPKPAYKPSVASAVMKALDTDNTSIFNSKLGGIKTNEMQYANRVKIHDAFEESLHEVIKSNNPRLIDSLFDDYKSAIVDTFDNVAVLSSGNDVRKSIIDELHTKYGLLNRLILNKDKNVRKGNMLSPDESALLQNIKSLLDQIGQLDAGGQAVSQGSSDQTTADDVNMAMKEKDVMTKEDDTLFGNEKDEDNTTEDDTIMKSDDSGVLGDDKAEDKAVDGDTKITEENIKVLKSVLNALVQKQKQVKQAVVVEKSSNSMVLLSNAVSELTKVVKSLNSRQNEADKAIGYILDGMGVTQQVKKSMNKPIITSPTDIGHPSQIDGMVSKSVKAGASDVGVQTKRSEVRKSLKEVIPSLFNREGRF